MFSSVVNISSVRAILGAFSLSILTSKEAFASILYELL